MWLPLLPFNKLMKEKIPWEGELPLGTGPFVGFGPPLKIDPYARLMSVSWVSFNKPWHLLKSS